MFGFLVLALVAAILTQNNKVIQSDKLLENELTAENYVTDKVHFDNLKRK